MNATQPQAFTHTISGRKTLRYLPHHHRGPQLNKRHAVNPGSLYEGKQVNTVCGESVRIDILGEVVAADGGFLWNCTKAADASEVTCKNCRKKLGL